MTHCARPAGPSTKSVQLKKKIIADLQLRNILGVAQDAPFRLRTSPWEESQRVILLGLTGSQGQPGLDGVDEEKWPA